MAIYFTIAKSLAGSLTVIFDADGLKSERLQASPPERNWNKIPDYDLWH